MKYIDAELLRKKIAEQMDSLPREVGRSAGTITSKGYGMMQAFQIMRSIIDSLQQEQRDFPTSDKECEEFLATHSEVEVPDKYKTPDWLWKKQEQPEVDLKNEIDVCWQNWLSPSNQKEVEGVLPKTEFAIYARHFYELGLNARKEEKL